MRASRALLSEDTLLARDEMSATIAGTLSISHGVAATAMSIGSLLSMAGASLFSFTRPAALEEGRDVCSVGRDFRHTVGAWWVCERGCRQARIYVYLGT